MKVVYSSKKHKEIFKSWQDNETMKIITCREIKNGKHYVNKKKFYLLIKIKIY